MERTLKTFICQRLRKLRKSKGYSQQEVADLLNMSQGTYSDLETGKTAIDMKNFQGLLKCFNIRLHNLLLPPDEI